VRLFGLSSDRRVDCIRMFRALRLTAEVILARRGRPAGTPIGGLVRALLVAVAATCGACGLSLVGPGICCRLGGTRDIPVEVLFP
jgi:hypothetical protein